MQAAKREAAAATEARGGHVTGHVTEARGDHVTATAEVHAHTQRHTLVHTHERHTLVHTHVLHTKRTGNNAL